VKPPKKRKPKAITGSDILRRATELATGKKVKRRPKPPPHFSIPQAFALAEDILSRPPAPGLHIKRPKPRGNVVARFALPLHLCPTTNSTRGMPGWKLANFKRAIGNLMLIQARPARAPLTGYPQVIARRFAHNESDPSADFAKMAIDRLVVGNPGEGKLGYLRDDRGSVAETIQYWEPAPKGEGCVIIEVRWAP